MTRLLNLGCGRPPWPNHFDVEEIYGIDLFEDLTNNIKRADLVFEPIPFDDDFFNFVLAENLIEHIPRLAYTPARRYPFVELMNEVWRVLVPGGIFVSVTPAYPDPVAFRDPTHVNFITEETWHYFCQTSELKARIYGFHGEFNIIGQEWQAYLLKTYMKKIPL